MFESTQIFKLRFILSRLLHCDMPSGQDDIVRVYRRSEAPNKRPYIFRIGFIDDSDYSFIVAFTSSAINVPRHGMGQPQGLFSIAVQKALLSYTLVESSCIYNIVPGSTPAPPPVPLMLLSSMGYHHTQWRFYIELRPGRDPRGGVGGGADFGADFSPLPALHPLRTTPSQPQGAPL